MAPIAIPLISSASGMSAVQSAFWLTQNIGTIMTLGGTGIAAAGAIQEGRAAHAQAKSAQRVTEYNALVQEREAKAIEQKARFDQRRQAERARRMRGKLRAELAGSGARIDVGAPLALQVEQSGELELENLLIGYEGQVGAEKALSQARLDRLQGQIYRQKGKAAKKASYFKAGSTLLTGFGSTW